PTMALLLRAKKHFGVFADALRARGIPVHILGLSGLLREPVIVDLVSALAVLADSTANAELLRLLAGARWAIGPADIRELHRLARELASHDDAGRRLPDEVIQAARHSSEDIDTSSLVEALDAIAGNRVPRAAWLEGFSAVGLERLTLAGRELATLRRRSGLRLADIVDAVVSELQLDVEATANPEAPLAVQSLEAFGEIVADFLTLAEDASLPAFLEWLDAAEQRESFAPRQDPPEPGSVQMMTIHAAKGLEWDYVALPRLVVDEMPSKPHDVAGWLVRGRLPFPFRGDAAELPTLRWEDVPDAEALETRLEEFIAQVRAQQLAEEWRLGYVAVTRPRAELFASASWWAGTVKPRGPSEMLMVMARATLGDAADEWPSPSELTASPTLTAAAATWPLDPLGSRAPVVRAAAAAVAEAGPVNDERLERLIEVLLAERDGTRTVAIERPVRIPASRVKDYLDNADDVLAGLARPMPQRPFMATRLGTLFHSWVEHRPEEAVEIDAWDDELELGDRATSDRFAELKATFERSVWGNLRPVDVEREIHVPLGGNVFICKIDAVYNLEGLDIGQPPGTRFQIVDWKTGAAPADARDLELKQSQLALYRIAYAKHLGIDPDEIDAVFYFVADDRVLRPARLMNEAEFVAAWTALDAERP
ncbi:MAG TPA: 3'-5' exonuclease, partial [Microbacteriaceae bacterium]|nr:3'-5' exonuclease [Microbacteriaceae bacterium]